MPTSPIWGAHGFHLDDPDVPSAEVEDLVGATVAGLHDDLTHRGALVIHEFDLIPVTDVPTGSTKLLVDRSLARSSGLRFGVMPSKS